MTLQIPNSLPEWCSRTELMLGSAAMQRLRASHVLVVGLGGVGGCVAEMLARSGVGRMTVVDADTVQPSNINRQLIATHSSLNRPKAEVWQERLLQINPEIRLTVIPEFITVEGVDELLDAAEYDFVADAIDSVAPKISLLAACYRRQIPVISAMGAGAKKDSMAIRCDDISHTHTCTLARAVRRLLRAEGIIHGIPVIYSTEKPAAHAVIEVQGERNKRSTAGTVSYLPALFGCHMAAHIIQTLTADL